MNVELLNWTEYPEETVCTAARNDYSDVPDTSFRRLMDDVDGDGLHEKKETLIHHLLDRGHFGPFEHAQFMFSVEGVSRSLMAQLARHVSFDIPSMRFEDGVVTIPELDHADVVEEAEMAPRYDAYDDDELLDVRREQFEAAIEQSFKAYRNLLEMGVAPQSARFVLPVGTKTNIVFSLNARSLMHVADIRAASDAQWEIRQMMERVLDAAYDVMPITFEYYDTEMQNRLAP